MKQIPASLLTLVAGIAITLLSVWYGGHHGLLPVQASADAPLVDNLFNVMVIIGTALFIIVEGAIVYFFIRYRRRPGDESDGVPLEGNLQLEIFWTAIPAIIVIGLGIYSVDVYREMGGLSVGDHSMHSSMMGQAPAAVVAQAPSEMASDASMLMADAGDGMKLSNPDYGFGASPGEEEQVPDVLVNVTGLQFAWLFNYPDGGMLTGELHIPVDQDVQLNIEAQDVIHSLWVPAFRLKQDAIPGKTTQLRFMATRPGTYDVICAELCGSYHGGMKTQVIVHPQEEFAQWVADNRVAASPEDGDAIAALPPGSSSLPVDPATLSKADYLTPYGDDLGLAPDHLPTTPQSS